ncbi:MAG: sporulation membrane protein YtaF [Firmicutes bacterium]|nr:sporulation membrane protein YtaF [Bacillota bacterium]
MIWLSITFVAIAVSFDAFFIGITYGLSRISISYLARILLSLVSGCTVLLAMLVGQYLGKLLTPSSANFVGGLILILLGLYTLWRNNRPLSPRVFIHVRIPILGLIIQVFQEPLSADYDHSLHISSAEALVLGAALALDAAVAGVGAAILQFPALHTASAVGAASFLFISSGIHAGERLIESASTKTKLQWIPGLLIILIGFFRILI